MDSGDAIQLIVLLLLILLSAFFSSAETAMTTVNKIRIMSLADDGNKKAKTLLKIIENPGKLLSTTCQHLLWQPPGPREFLVMPLLVLSPAF